MEQWEFLLQREGTNNWQALDGSQGEIPTGKYRLICRTPWSDREIPVLLSYTPAAGKAKVKKRSPRSNSKGLMVVMPFTLLQSGHWQWQVFHPEAGEEMLTEITLTVAAIAPTQVSSEVLAAPSSPAVTPVATPKVEPPHPPASVSPSIPPSIPSDNTSSQNPARPLISIDALREQSLAEIDSVLQEAIDGVWSQLDAEPIFEADPVFLDYAEYSTEYNGEYSRDLPDYGESYYPAEEELEPRQPATPPLREFTLPADSLPSSPSLSFCLDQDHFTAQPGEYLVINGRVELSVVALLSDAELPADLQDTLLQGSIQYQLRDPSSAGILLTVEYPVAVKVPVGDFSHTLKIPPKTNSQLILGEATLYGKEEQVLASQSFMVSSGLANLLEVVKTTPEDFSQPSSTAPSKRQNHPVLSYQPITPPYLSPHRGVPKPIGRKAPGMKTKPLDLPDFSGRNSSKPSFDSDNHSTVDSGNRSASDRPNLEFPYTPAEINQNQHLDRQQPETPSPALADYIILDPSEPDPIANTVTSTNSAISLTGTGDSSSEKVAGLQPDDFLSRLNSLASDRQMTEILHTDLLLENAAPGAPQKQLLPATDESSWAAQEVVVDDEPPQTAPEPRFDSSGFPYPQELRSEAVVPATPQPVPIPEIIVPEGELLTGDTVIVAVKLPPEQFSLYVKFWVKDCQTTAIIDGPRMLLDFSPNSQGELETLTRLTIPPGCCRVRLEAIAIDPHQEAESRKTSVDRVVVPPGLSPTPDFNYLAS